MPIAAFTTLAVLGGGAGEPPAWMRPGSSQIDDDAQEQLDSLSAGLNQLAAEVAHSQASQPTLAYTPAIVQHVMVPAAQPVQTPPPVVQDHPSMVDDLDIEGLLSNAADHSPPRPVQQPSHNEPVIRGFDVESSDKP